MRRRTLLALLYVLDKSDVHPLTKAELEAAILSALLKIDRQVEAPSAEGRTLH